MHTRLIPGLERDVKEGPSRGPNQVRQRKNGTSILVQLGSESESQRDDGRSVGLGWSELKTWYTDKCAHDIGVTADAVVLLQ